MNCRDYEPLILAERDSVLTKDQLAALSHHVAACPACARLRVDLSRANAAYRAHIASLSIPAASESWRDLEKRLQTPLRPEKKQLGPLIWFGAPLAAAAALAIAFTITEPSDAEPRPELVMSSPVHDPSIIAGADFVEAGDPEASVLVYVDKDSGWLVVWATDSGIKNRG